MRRARLDILVENCGRINYGGYFSHDRKGIVGAARYANEALRDGPFIRWR